MQPVSYENHLINRRLTDWLFFCSRIGAIRTGRDESRGTMPAPGTTGHKNHEHEETCPQRR